LAMFAFNSGKDLVKKDRQRPVQRSVSLNSDKSVVGLKLWVLWKCCTLYDKYRYEH